MQNKIREIWLLERPQWIVWVPILFGVGVGIYFKLHVEPPFIFSLGIAVVCGIVALICLKARLYAIAIIALGALFMAAGMGVATLRTQAVSAPILHSELWPRTVSGTIETLSQKPDKTRLILRDITIERVQAHTTPAKVTLSLSTQYVPSMEVGDRIEAYAGFYPPPKPAYPEGFQFNRHFFFKQIGATGYGVGKQPVRHVEPAMQHGLHDQINRWRFSLAEQLRTHMGGREGAVASALTMGDGKSIPEDVREDMRAAGLAHVLAISGMHLGLVAGMLFFVIRFVLVCVPGFALHRNAKKWAATLALAGAGMYLLMAGMPISAQRAYVMVALVLLAVLLDRYVSPLRSLALAAMIILLMTPEAILTPSFQLSFAATLGILAYYEQWRVKKFQENTNISYGWKKKLIRFWGGITITSILATGATLPFILHHFDSFPTFGLLGNLIALPLLSFAIMPLIVALLALMPLGAHVWLFAPLKLTISWMLSIAHWIASLPYANLSLPPLSTLGLVVVVLGGLWLCIWQTRWRHFGWIGVALGLGSVVFYQPPDIIISADGKKVALRINHAQAVMLHGRSSGFTQDQWLHAMRVDEFDRLSKHKNAPITCDNLGCIYSYNNVKVAIAEHRAALAEDCAQADFVITPNWSLYHNSTCPVASFDHRWLAQEEGAALWLQGKGQYRVETVRQHLGVRPWNP